MPAESIPLRSPSDPPALLAIVRAARQVGDRDLERAARRLLRERYGIDIAFRQERKVPDAAG
jgi:hypothetical protein